MNTSNFLNPDWWIKLAFRHFVVILCILLFVSLADPCAVRPVPRPWRLRIHRISHMDRGSRTHRAAPSTQHGGRRAHPGIARRGPSMKSLQLVQRLNARRLKEATDTYLEALQAAPVQASEAQHEKDP